MSNIKNPQNNPLKNPAPVRPPGGSTALKTVYVCSPFRPTARYPRRTGRQNSGPISNGHSKPAASSP